MTVQPNTPTAFEDEIDLREYATMLLRHWRLIAALTLVAAAIAGVVSFIIPPIYEATAVISTTAAGIPAVATSDAVLQDVIASLGSTLPTSLASPAALRPLLAATQTASTTAIQLKVTDGDAARAAAIANAWADAVRQAPLLAQSNLITSLKQSASEAGIKRDAAAKAFTAYQAASQAITWQAQLAGKQNALSIAYSNQETLRTALQDAKSLRDRLAKLDPAAPPSLGDYLALIALSQRSVLSNSGPSLQLQAPTAPLSGITVGEQIGYLDQLMPSLQSRLAQVEDRARQLNAEILALQAALVEAQAKEASLKRDWDEAAAAYTNLSASLAQAKLSADSVNISVSAVAGVPQSPTSPKKAQNAALAAALGLMAGVFAAFGWEWWKGGMRNVEPPKGAEKLSRE